MSPKTVHGDAATSGVHRRDTALKGGRHRPPPVGSSDGGRSSIFQLSRDGVLHPSVGRNETLGLLLQNNTLKSFRKFSLGRAATGRIGRDGGVPAPEADAPTAPLNRRPGEEIRCYRVASTRVKHHGDRILASTYRREDAAEREVPFYAPTRPFALAFRAPSERREPVRLRRPLRPPGYERLGESDGAPFFTAPSPRRTRVTCPPACSTGSFQTPRR